MERSVQEGQLGCPVCGRTYAIEQGIVRFGPAPGFPSQVPSSLTAEAVEAFLGLSGPGGYVVLVGIPLALCRSVAERASGGIHVVSLNPADSPAPGTVDRRVSIAIGERIPLKRRSVRGVVLGQAYASDPGWRSEAARVALPGRRVVGEGDGGWGGADGSLGTGDLDLIAGGRGVWVAEVGKARG